MKTVYTIKERKDSGEFHLFDGLMQNKDYCSVSSWSLCSSVEENETVSEGIGCLTEDQARIEAAKIGRAVCGNCIKTLYATYY